jgi:chain length determinant protein tyrosine kinase EpsG
MSAEESVVKSMQWQFRGADSPDMHIGQVLLRAGKLTEGDINRIVSLQSTQEVRFGEAALRLGMVDRRDVQQALSLQFAYPYLNEGESPLSPELVAAYQPFSAQAEAVRRLRTQLSLRWFNPQRSLAVSSTRANEGASLIAANLAIAFSQVGERTLLIDANFRTPRQHALFGVSLELGLSTVLVERSTFDEALSSIEMFDNLTVLGTGPIPPNPQELLLRPRFRQVMQLAPERYDVVIVDTPPLLEFSEAQTIAARTGGCLLAMRRHGTRVADVEHAKALLQPAAATLVGTALCS